MQRIAPRAKQVTHERIVAAAARAIKRSGYDGTSVADIMKEAGLTHGGFYAHFASREAMLAEAADRACRGHRSAGAGVAAVAVRVPLEGARKKCGNGLSGCGPRF
jgi:TetR/AcrR family transcriptional regulator, transcriptional repressor for nem operon